jgi:hypothetical protein
MKTTHTEYQFFVFSQLAVLHINEAIEDAPYDIIYPIIVDELHKFIENNDFNTESQSEYDCMNLYLECMADDIALRIADHSEL